MSWQRVGLSWVEICALGGTQLQSCGWRRARKNHPGGVVGGSGLRSGLCGLGLGLDLGRALFAFEISFSTLTTFRFVVLLAHKNLYIFAARTDFVAVTMIIGRDRFNIYLLPVLFLAMLSGCKTVDDNPNQEVATLRVHIEVSPSAMDFSTKVPVFRASPVMVTVDKEPFLTETHVSGAKVVDVPGGFNLEIHFNRQGTWLLEEYTTTHPGRRIAIFSAFGDKQSREARWLGAPLIAHRIDKGVLSFAPDATRDEAELIARGLDLVGRQNKESLQW
jgi:hypothetical protein